MLTGDKIETAICIAISSGLKDEEHEIFVIKETFTEEEITLKLEEF